MKRYSQLRQYIRGVLREAADSEEDENLLVEPDLSPEREEDDKVADEVSAIASGGVGNAGTIRGATTPLGTSATYPAGKKKKKKKRSLVDVVGGGFGGATLYDPKKLKN
jgi:hypothetical protein